MTAPRDDAFLPPGFAVAVAELERLGCRLTEATVLEDEVWVSLASGLTAHGLKANFRDCTDAEDWARVVASQAREAFA